MIVSLPYTLFSEKDEMYCLTSQFRRSSISITANIAEGFAKRSNLDKIRILNIAQGSLEETRYYIILANDLEYGYDQNLEELAEEVSKLLHAYIKAIEARTK